MLILIIPIGGPGAGKTTLSHKLMNGGSIAGVSKIDKVLTTCRDELFAQCKKVHSDWSQRKIRRYLFDKFVEFREDVAQWRTENPDKNLVVYLDSSNAQQGGRQYLIDEFQPDKVIFLNMRRCKETLMERVGQREEHPTFPRDTEEQRIIINKIMKGLEFADESDLTMGSTVLEKEIVEM